MKLEVNLEEGGIILSEVYNGIGIRTEVGLFGVAERDGGIEIMLNGKFLFAHDINGSRLPEKPKGTDLGPGWGQR
jgi:hypothetical protein